jgi:GNAT superfamily N-acetyltransferase
MAGRRLTWYVRPLDAVTPEIRRVTDTDDVEAITQLVRAAYAPHLAEGLRFWGTRQTVDETARRLASGAGFVAIESNRYIGVIVVRPPQPGSPVELYRDSNVWSIGQFCVAPEYKGMGLGRKLHEIALAYASEHGAQFMALDTAEPAKELIELYQRWGYAAVGSHDWRPHTNYVSVLMKRPIGADVERAA